MGEETGGGLFHRYHGFSTQSVLSLVEKEVVSLGGATPCCSTPHVMIPRGTPCTDEFSSAELTWSYLTCHNRSLVPCELSQTCARSMQRIHIIEFNLPGILSRSK